MEEVFNGDSEDEKDLIDGYEGNGILTEKQIKPAKGVSKCMFYLGKRDSVLIGAGCTQGHTAHGLSGHNDAQPQSLE